MGEQTTGYNRAMHADRTLELRANWMFAAVFATVLVQYGVPALRGGLVTMLAAVEIRMAVDTRCGATP